MKFKTKDVVKIINKTKGEKFFENLKKYEFYTIEEIEKDIDYYGEYCIKVYFKEFKNIFYFFDESDLRYKFEEDNFISEEEFTI